MCRAEKLAGRRGRAGVRLGSRDRIVGWQAVVANTWDIDKREDTWSDRVDRVKTAGVQVERAAHEDLASGWSKTATRVGGGRVRGTLLTVRFGGLGLKTIGGGFRGFGPQNPDGGSNAERMARGGIREIASKQGYR